MFEVLSRGMIPRSPLPSLSRKVIVNWTTPSNGKKKPAVDFQPYKAEYGLPVIVAPAVIAALQISVPAVTLNDELYTNSWAIGLQRM
eukprot:45159-Eustigmatos_ZCMA.PRE.1